MKTFFFSILAGVLSIGISFSQSNAQAQGSASASQGTAVSESGNAAAAQSGTSAQTSGDAAVSTQPPTHSAEASASSQTATNKTVGATLEKSVDARKNKPGDEVVAKTTQATTSNEGVAIPKGSKIIGHVTEAKAKEKGESQSAVGVVFDHAVLKNGQQVPMNASIQAIATSERNAPTSMMDDQPMMNGGGMTGATGGASAPAVRGAGGGVMGASSTLGSATSSVSSNAAGTLNSAASAPNGAASGALSSTSHGVTGINGLSLNTAAANSTEGSVFTSTTHNVHLDSGTAMILQIAK